MMMIIISGWLFVARWKSHFLTFCDIPCRRWCNKNKWKIRNSFLSIVQSIQMPYWPHWTNNQIICDWQNVLSYLFWILLFTIASISVFFFVFSYMNKEHIKRSTSYTNTNQIKSHSYYKIKPTTTKRFFITDHHHTYIYLHCCWRFYSFEFCFMCGRVWYLFCGGSWFMSTSVCISFGNLL